MFPKLRVYGEIPGREKKLEKLLYPFFNFYPLKMWSKFRWWKNGRLKNYLSTLNTKGKYLTVIDRLGAPGDALLTANVIRCIKKVYPNLKINCITPNPEIICFDPCIETINKPESFYSFDSTYWELIVRKEKVQNIISHNLLRLGIEEYEYKAKFFLLEREREWAKDKIKKRKRPLIGICTKSKETVKNWPQENWVKFINSLRQKHDIMHLGDASEPDFEGVSRFAGKTSIRESAALLNHCDVFVSPDSLLMHIANGLDIPSVIIFGGSRPVSCFGYEKNSNIADTPECSPCWIHDGYEECKESLKCLLNISTDDVLKKTYHVLKNQLN